MSESPHLGLGYLAPAQAQKHVAVNEALRRLDALVQMGVLTRTLTAPPPSPVEGDRHIVGPSATGAWAGQSGRVAAFADGVWTFIAPKPGWLAYVAAENALLVFAGGAWTGALGVLSSLDGLAQLGVNATADAVNRLAVASAAALFTHVGAGCQIKLNKATATDVASLLLQTAYGGRAELGLVGSDAFALKVSADGSSWITALEVAQSDGAVGFARSPQRTQVDAFTAGGTWTKPAWAGRVTVMLAGGGGGGGGGGCGDASANRAGGAGGGAGAVVAEQFEGADITAACTVTIGAGGAPGLGVAAGASASGGPGGAGGASGFRLNDPAAAAQALTASGGAGGPGGASANTTGGLGGAGLYGASNNGGNGSATGAGAGAVTTLLVRGPGGGAGGGGLATTTSSGGFAGGAGAAGYAMGATARQSAGGTSGAAGLSGSAGAGRAWSRGAGGGGGGGGSHVTAAAGSGGDGGSGGGGGGGGGAGRPSGGSGAGGRGGDGCCVIISYAM